MVNSESKTVELHGAPRSFALGTNGRLALIVVAYSLYAAARGRALDQESIELALRLQGRLSFLLFLLALAGPGLHALSASRASAGLARERDALFRAYALSHFIHAAWVALYYARSDAVFRPFYDGSGVVAFALGIVFLLPRTLRLGAGWARAELGVIAYIWVQFAGFLIDRFIGGRIELRPWYVTGIALAIGAAALEWWNARRMRRSNPSTGG